MRSRKVYPLFLSLLVLGLAAGTPRPLVAQHEHHEPPPPPTPGPTEPRDVGKEGRNLFQSDMALMAGMTARDPAGSAPSAGWSTHLLGIARLSYNDQGGPSGDSSLESSNWSMVMAQRTAGPGRLTFMLMNSVEPATIPEEGSPELFQTGESFEGNPLVDRQHPHDFFMNLSATYRLAMGSRSAAWVQLAPVGEPALGPAAFMHRASSGENPTSPLGHHWQDSTHIAWNVATVGAGWEWVSLEASVFHGEEPDEERWNIDGGSPDSFSGRLTLRFPTGWSGQVSHGYLHDPEALEAGDTHRSTASLHYGAAGDGPVALMLLWGRNNEGHGTTDAFLLEGAWQLTRADQLYGRAEYVEKDFELLRFKESHHHAGETPEIAEIGALTAGYLRDFDLSATWNVGIGADLTVYHFPSALEPTYGKFPVSGHAYIRLRWGKAHGDAHAGHAM